jgi:hypothetical protein
MSGHRHVAVADWGNRRVSVFSVEGEFVRHVGVGELRSCDAVSCSAFDELVVADYDDRRVVVFSASGELLMSIGCGGFTAVALVGSTLLAFATGVRECVLFE